MIQTPKDCWHKQILDVIPFWVEATCFIYITENRIPVLKNSFVKTGHSKGWFPEFSATKHNSPSVSEMILSSSGWSVMVMKSIAVVPWGSVLEPQTYPSSQPVIQPGSLLMGRAKSKGGGVISVQLENDRPFRGSIMVPRV